LYSTLGVLSGVSGSGSGDGSGSVSGSVGRLTVTDFEIS